jgi:hypothetical protein
VVLPNSGKIAEGFYSFYSLCENLQLFNSDKPDEHILLSVTYPYFSVLNIGVHHWTSEGSQEG